MKEIDKVRDKVEKVLRESPKARNSDMFLMLMLWQKEENIKVYIPYENIKDMAKPETIGRARRQIQNSEGRYLPTDEEIKNKRGIKQEEFREHFGK